MPQVDLIQSNIYHTANAETSHAIYNFFINQNKQLETVWGYEAIEDDIKTNTPIYARMITSNQKYVIIADGQGVIITEYNGTSFTAVTRKLYFLDVRNPKYDNGIDYNVNPKGFSIIDNGFGIIFITDGSVGGLYLLYIPYDINNNAQFDNIIFKQFNFAGVTKTVDGAFVAPYVQGKLIYCVKPSNLEYFNTHVVLIDDYLGSMFVIDAVYLNAKQDDFDYGDTTITQPYIMQSKNCSIIQSVCVNSILFVIGTKLVEKYYANTGLLPIARYQDTSREVGCLYRSLATAFNGKLIFLGSSDDKKFVLNIWEGGDSPREIQLNNLSEIFQNIELRGLSYQDVNITAFGTHAQEFVLINGIYKNTAVLVNIYSEESFFIQQKTRFPADDIFRFVNQYFFTSTTTRSIYRYSELLNSFNGIPINPIIRTMQFSSSNPNSFSKIENLEINIASLPHDLQTTNERNGVGYVQDKTKVGVTIFFRTEKTAWMQRGKHFLMVNNKNPSYKIPYKLCVARRVQLAIHFHQKLYTDKMTNDKKYSKILINNITCIV